MLLKDGPGSAPLAEPLEDLLQDRKLLVGRCQLRLKSLDPRARPVRNIPALSPAVLMVAMSNVDPLTPVAQDVIQGVVVSRGGT